MDLVFLACLVAAPLDCRPERLPVSLTPVPEALCARAAPFALAEWAGAHPDRQPVRWRCEPSRGDRK